MSIHDLAAEGARLMQQLKTDGENAELRGPLNEIARRIETEWQASDVESVEKVPPYFHNIATTELGGFVRLWIRDTNRTVAIDGRGWGFRLIHHYVEKDKRK